MKYLLLISLFFICSCSDYINYIVVTEKHIDYDYTGNYCIIKVYSRASFAGYKTFDIKNCNYNVGDTLGFVVKGADE